MVRAHRQAWCWQDEWFGLSMENIRELEKEAQLMLSRKMAQFSEDDDEASELDKGKATQDQAPGEPPQPSSSGGEPLTGRGLKKQWSTSSKSSRSSKRGGEPGRCGPSSVQRGPLPVFVHPSDSPHLLPKKSGLLLLDHVGHTLRESHPLSCSQPLAAVRPPRVPPPTAGPPRRASTAQVGKTGCPCGNPLPAFVQPSRLQLCAAG